MVFFVVVVLVLIARKSAPSSKSSPLFGNDDNFQVIKIGGKV